MVASGAAPTRGYSLGFLAYLAGFSVLIASGLPAAHVIPLVPLLFLSVMAAAIFLVCSKVGSGIAAAFSLSALTAFQGFRLPLEAILHRWAELGTVPPTMTWTGQNWKLVTGAASLALAGHGIVFRKMLAR